MNTYKRVNELIKARENCTEAQMPTSSATKTHYVESTNQDQSAAQVAEPASNRFQTAVQQESSDENLESLGNNAAEVRGNSTEISISTNSATELQDVESQGQDQSAARAAELPSISLQSVLQQESSDSNIKNPQTTSPGRMPDIRGYTPLHMATDPYANVGGSEFQ
jgi:hypothetical protein